jgi:FAD-dependent urate hydroxylase
LPAPYRILIVGGGIGGLALGRALGQRGFTPEIIACWILARTRRRPLRPWMASALSRGLVLPTKYWLELSAWSHQRVLDHTGRQLADIELTVLWKPVGPCLGITRREFHRVLLDGAAGVPIRLGTTVTTLSQEASKVNVLFADGSSSTYDVVVGADGIHSSVRQLAFGRIRPRPLGQVSWRFVVDYGGSIKPAVCQRWSSVTIWVSQGAFGDDLRAGGRTL